MLTRLLSFVAVLVLACASPAAHAIARAPERVSAPLSEQVQEWKSARRGSAEVPSPASNETSELGDCRVGENWHPPLKVTSDTCLYAYANPTVWVDLTGRDDTSAHAMDLCARSYEQDPARLSLIENRLATHSAERRQRAKDLSEVDASVEWLYEGAATVAKSSAFLLLAKTEENMREENGPATARLRAGLDAGWKRTKDDPASLAFEGIRQRGVQADDAARAGDEVLARKLRWMQKLDIATGFAGATGLVRSFARATSGALTRELATVVEGASEAPALRGGAQFFDADVVAELDEAYRPAGRGIDVLHSPEIEVPFGTGIGKQGYAYENALASRLPADSRLPPNFKTFDFFDDAMRNATSAKTLDTTTRSRTADPTRVYTSLRRNVDAATNFNGYTLGETELLPDKIDLRVVRVAVPLETDAGQWGQIRRAIDYAKEQGVRLEPEVVTNSSTRH